MAQPHLALRDIERIYRKNSASFSLRIERFEIEEGERVVVLGENGSGKSTLARIAGLIEKPDRGEVVFRGMPLRNKKEAENARRKIATVLQKPVSFRGSVLRNLELAAHIRGLSLKDYEDLISELNLGKLLHKDASAISYGELRRVQLAQALIGSPEIVIFDEPTSFLDERRRADFLELLSSGALKNSKTFLFITHRLDEALLMGERFVFLNDGRIIHQGKIEEFFYRAPEVFEKLYGCFSVVRGRVIEASGRLVSIETEGGTVSGHSDWQIETGSSACALIRCDTVVLSEQPEKSSSVNNFRAVVEDVEDIDGFSRVYFREPFLLKAVITRASRERLNLYPGAYIYVSVKAAAVRIFKNSGEVKA
jgi:molybdopterin-binding protein